MYLLVYIYIKTRNNKISKRFRHVAFAIEKKAQREKYRGK